MGLGSGSLSLSQIRGEFGGGTPDSLSEYYAGGSYVSSGTSGSNGAVPSSGAIAFSKFNGTSNKAPPGYADLGTVSPYCEGGSFSGYDGTRLYAGPASRDTKGVIQETRGLAYKHTYSYSFLNNGVIQGMPVPLNAQITQIDLYLNVRVDSVSSWSWSSYFNASINGRALSMTQYMGTAGTGSYHWVITPPGPLSNFELVKLLRGEPPPGITTGYCFFGMSVNNSDLNAGANMWMYDAGSYLRVTWG